MAEIRYEWTGGYRPPKQGEWYLIGYEPHRASFNFENECYFILRRVEVSEVDDGA